MSIRVYDFDYNLLAETERVVSREWELKFNGIGSFEGSFDLNTGFASVFADNRYLILCDGDNQAICVGSRIDDRLRVYGRTPEWLLSKRVVLPFKSREIFGEAYTDPETIILYLLDKAYKTPVIIGEDGTVSTDTDESAVCADLIIPDAVGCEKLSRHFWRNSANPLSEVIGDLCDLIGCGYSLRFCPDEKCWRFSLEFGSERGLVISKSLKNAYDMCLKESCLETASGGYFEVYSAEDSEEQAYGYISGEGGGAGLLKWDKVLASASGLSEAEKLLAASGVDISVECEVIGAEYGVDYALGDTLRLQVELGDFRRTLRQRVDGVSIISGSDGKSVKPVFTTV